MNSVRVSIDLAAAPDDAFGAALAEVAGGLARLNIAFEPSPNGRLTERGAVVGRTIAFEPGRRVALAWRPADWRSDFETEVELSAEQIAGGARIVLEHRGLAPLLGDSEEFLGWFARQVAAPFLQQSAPRALGDWITDRGARHPSGKQASERYRDPLYHYPSFRVILEVLALSADDYLLDLGCGGGAFLKDALKSGCSGAGIDHSPEMVAVARVENAAAVAEGRLDVVLASVERLPYKDDTFTAATMHGVLAFLADPVSALAEVRRVLRPGGRLVLLGADPELKGTPASPEPMASRLYFYGDEGLAALGRRAGFRGVQVVRRNLTEEARAVGVPEDHLAIFSGHDARFLLAEK